MTHPHQAPMRRYALWAALVLIGVVGGILLGRFQNPAPRAATEPHTTVCAWVFPNASYVGVPGPFDGAVWVCR